MGRRRVRSVLLIAAVTVLVIAMDIEGPVTGLAERVTVDAFEALQDPDAVIAQLRRAGIDAEIYMIPLGSASNERPGVWVDVGFENPKGSQMPVVVTPRAGTRG